jgi:2-polyprenyl-3-methyl-5-hydroxy-6-metoxy-1,4-benzoquinol methylase
MNYPHGPHYSRFTDLDNQSESLKEIEKFSDNYLKASVDNKVWPIEYNWPFDSLRTNTRLWEYPYVIDVIRKFSRKNCKVMDIGSALTFFPYFLADRGYDVYATDIDKRMKPWSKDIEAVLKEKSIIRPDAKIQYVIQDLTKDIKLTEKFDVVTNISVLEHIPIELLPTTVENVHHSLNDDGIFICTLDVLVNGSTLKGHHPLNSIELNNFLDELKKHFEFIGEFSLTSPSDLITNIKYPKGHYDSPFRLQKKSKVTLKNRIATAVNGFRMKEKPVSLEWTAYACVLKKK